MRSLRRLATAAALGALAACGASCAIPAWLAAQFAPPKKVDAEYKPPEDKTILVFVDDLLNPVSSDQIKIELTNKLNELLAANKVAGQTIPYSRLADLVSASPKFNELAVSQVGQKLQADMVLYVRIDDFALKDPSAPMLWKGRLGVTVRMVDSQKGRLWPTDRPDGYTVPNFETPVTPAESADDQADELIKTLAANVADRVAKLFYDHTTPHEGGWTGP